MATIGRTGAGKGCLYPALLRALEVDNDGGYIELEGVDMARVELVRLRSAAITIILQHPQLFCGSVCIKLDLLGRS